MEPFFYQEPNQSHSFKFDCRLHHNWANIYQSAYWVISILRVRVQVSINFFAVSPLLTYLHMNTIPFILDNAPETDDRQQLSTHASVFRRQYIHIVTWTFTMCLTIEGPPRQTWFGVHRFQFIHNYIQSCQIDHELDVVKVWAIIPWNFVACWGMSISQSHILMTTATSRLIS